MGVPARTDLRRERQKKTDGDLTAELPLAQPPHGSIRRRENLCYKGRRMTRAMTTRESANVLQPRLGD
jgi:hypothetical protein